MDVNCGGAGVSVALWPLECSPFSFSSLHALVPPSLLLSTLLYCFPASVGKELPLTGNNVLLTVLLLGL